VKVTPFISSCNSKDIGKTITNINSPSTSKSQNKTAAAVAPVIISAQTTAIGSTSASLEVNLNSAATVYYLCLPSGYSTISNKSLIISMNSSIGLTGKNQSGAMSIYSGSTSQLNYKATLSLSSLKSTSNYDLYVVA
jgi:hypothetical protein